MIFFTSKEIEFPPFNTYVITALFTVFFVFVSCKNQTKNTLEIAHYKIYPAPEEISLSKAFMVTIEGENVPLYKAKVPAIESIPRLKHNPSKYGIASYGSFDVNDTVAVEVSYFETIKKVKILPTSYGIKYTVINNKVSFKIDKPMHVTVEVNGHWQESLHLFVNPFEKNIPDPKDPNVIYFGPGVHEVSSLIVTDNTTVYLAGGAYIKAGYKQGEEKIVDKMGKEHYPPTFILEGNNSSIRGRGIIDQQNIPKALRRYTVLVQDSDKVTLDGVIIHDPSHWTIPIKRSKNVHINNIKIIGRRGNADGVDISSSTDVLVENCFLRTLDDLVVVKSRTGQGEAKNINVRKCVLWNEYAHALSIGAELRENVSNVVFEDCDIIHDIGRETALRVYHCDDAVVSNITFKNIRVEEARRLISVWIGKTRWTKTKERGNIRGVLFKNITAISAPIDTTLTGFQDGIDWKPYIIRDQASIEVLGFDKDHTAENIVFENVVIDGQKIQKNQMSTNSFVKDIRLK